MSVGERPFARIQHEPLDVVPIAGGRGLRASIATPNTLTPALAAAIAAYRPPTRRQRFRWAVGRVRSAVGFWIAGYDPRED